MKILNKTIRAAALAGLFSVASLSAGTITEITLGDFVTPLVLDFESEATGAIADNDPLFASIGISSVSGTASTYTDDFQDRQNSSTRALWFIAGDQLVIVDPANSGAAQYAQRGISYTIDLVGPATRFGFSTHDEPFADNGADPLTITFYAGAIQVGSTASSGVLWAGSGPNPLWDRRDFYFENTEAFDRIVLTTNSSQDQGFAFDNLTTDASELTATPEPGAFALFGLGLLGAAAMGRKRRR